MKTHYGETRANFESVGRPLRRGGWWTLAAGLIFLVAAVLAQPANDRFGDRLAVTGTNVDLQGTMAGATWEEGEPFAPAIWWEWTAPAEGEALITRHNSEVLASAGVFAGTSLSNLQALAWLSEWDNAAIFTAAAGARYEIAVGGISGAPVDFALRLVPRPPNQSFAGRISLGSGDVRVQGAFGSSTNRAFDPYDGLTWGTVWYSWTASTSGPVSLTLDVETGVRFTARPFTSLCVYVGQREDQLTRVSCSHAGDHFGETFAAETTFEAQAGATYQVSVSGKQFPGDFTLAVLQHAAPSVLLAAPALSAVFHLGDTIPLRALAADPEGRVSKVEFFRTLHTPDFAPDYWNFFELLATTATWPFVAFWTPEAPGSFILLARAEDESGARRCSPARVVDVRPRNDDFADRIVLSGAWLTVTGFCGSATREPGEPESTGPATAWWSWTAPQTGPVTISTETPYALTVFTGNELTNLAWLAGSVWTPHHSRVAFAASAGATYQIAASASSSWGGPDPISLTITPSLPPSIAITSPTNDTTVLAGTGFEVLTAVAPGSPAISRVEFYSGDWLLGTSSNAPFSWAMTTTVSDSWNSRTLQARVVDEVGLDAWSDEVSVFIQPPPPPNDNFINRFTMTGSSWTTVGSTAGATTEAGEPPPGYSAWWSWTAPFSGHCTVLDTNGSDQISVFTGSSVTNLTAVAVSANLNGSSAAVFQALAGTTYALAVSGGGLAELSLVPSAPPTLSFLTPTNNPQVISGHPFRLEVEAADTDGLVTNVEFFLWDDLTGFRRLGATSQPPYAITVSLEATNWTPFSLWAYATDDAGLVASAGVAVFVHPPPAGNDDFANRLALTGVSLLVRGTTVYATQEPGEPGCNSESVWWTWTAPVSGPTTLAFTTSGAYSVLTVFEGDAIANLTQVAQAINSDPFDPALAVFNARAGTTYQISASQGGPVSFQIAMSQPPAIALAGPTNEAVFTFGSPITLEANASDPEGALNRVDFYVNYQWVGSVTNPPYRLEFEPPWSQAYRWRAVATDDQGLSRYSPDATFTVEPAAAPNDDFAHRIALSGFMAHAGWEYADYAAGTAWWTWRAPASGIVRVQGRDWSSSRIQVFAGAGPEVADLVAIGDGTSAGFTFEAAAGTTYQIAVEHLRYDYYLPLELVLDSPAAAIIDRIACDPFGGVRLHATTLSQQPWLLLASTNLVDWQTIATNASGTQAPEFVDPEGPSRPAGFYRLLSAPR